MKTHPRFCDSHQLRLAHGNLVRIRYRLLDPRLSSLALSLVILAAGCTSKHPGDDVSATVDGRKIYRADVEKYYQNQTAGSDQQPVGEQATSLRLSILKELIDNEILMRRAEKLGLLATDEEVDAKLNEIKSPYSKEQFEARLQEKKISAGRFQARSAPLAHGRQGPQQGNHLEDQRLRSGRHQLLQRAQG